MYPGSRRVLARQSALISAEPPFFCSLATLLLRLYR